MRAPSTFLLLLGVTVSSTALAQAFVSQTALNRYNPSERGSHWFSVDSLELDGDLRAAVGLTLDYGDKPLSLFRADGTERASIVAHQFVGHAGASLTVASRFRFGVSLPVALSQSGSSGVFSGFTFPAPSAQAVGDLRFGADVRLVGTHDEPFTAAVGLQVFVPTGKADAYAGEGLLRVAPHLLAAGKVSRFVYALRGEYGYRNVSTPLDGRSTGGELLMGASAGVELANGALTVGPEAFAAVGLQKGGYRGLPVEALLGAHYRFGGFQVGLGAGAELSRRQGTARMRGLLSFEWLGHSAPEAPVEPLEPSFPALAPEPKKTEPAVEKKAPEPADNDKDGIADADDACPNEAGLPENKGCPASDTVKVTEEKLVIRDRILFKTGQAALQPSALPILKEVARVLNAHPELPVVNVEGHTDNSGSEIRNRALSKARADAVVGQLIKAGVAAKRLNAVGYGPSRPVDDNGTPAGRTNNRRVEFTFPEAP